MSLLLFRMFPLLNFFVLSLCRHSSSVSFCFSSSPAMPTLTCALSTSPSTLCSHATVGSHTLCLIYVLKFMISCLSAKPPETMTILLVFGDTTWTIQIISAFFPSPFDFSLNPSKRLTFAHCAGFSECLQDGLLWHLVQTPGAINIIILNTRPFEGHHT